MTHDWPTGIVRYGDGERLLRSKPFFRDEVNEQTRSARARIHTHTHTA